MKTPGQFWSGVGNFLSGIRLRPEVKETFSNIGSAISSAYLDNQKKAKANSDLLKINRERKLGGLPMISLNDYISQINDPKNTVLKSNPGEISQSLALGSSSNANPILQVGSQNPNQIDTSNLRVTYDSIQKGITDVQTQIDEAKKSINQNPQGGQNGQSSQQDSPAYFDKAIEMADQAEKKIAGMPSLPSLDEATNVILAKFGFTPESFKQVAELNTQLGTVNDQINELETARQNELSRIETTGGKTIGAYGAEEVRINREYAIRQAGLGAKASVLTAQISALTGAYEKAESAAKDFVDFATSERKQFIDDIRYSLNFYKDVYKSMDESDRQRVNDVLDYQVTTYNQERDEYWKQMNYQLDVWKAQNSGTGSGSSANLDVWANGLMTGQFGLQNVPMGLRNAVLGRIQELGGNVISTTFAGKAKDAIASFNSAEGMLQQIEDLSAPIANAGNFVTANLGGLMGWIGGKTGASQNSKLYMNTRDSFLSLLSRAAGEKGVLTDSDIARIKNALPALNDTAVVKEQKLKILRGLFSNIKTGALNAYTQPLGSSSQSGGGSDLSSFEKP